MSVEQCAETWEDWRCCRQDGHPGRHVFTDSMVAADSTGYVTRNGAYTGQLYRDTEGDGRPYVLLEIGRGWKADDLRVIADFLEEQVRGPKVSDL